MQREPKNRKCKNCANCLTNKNNIYFCSAKNIDVKPYSHCESWRWLYNFDCKLNKKDKIILKKFNRIYKFT